MNTSHRIRRWTFPAALGLVLTTTLAAHAADARTLPVMDVHSLPLVELPAARPGGHTLAVILTGDGDWAPFVRDMSTTLSADGIAAVALKSRSFLSRPRTPEDVAAAVDAIIRHYLPAWGKDEVVLVGYSRGADIVPFVANRLPADVRGKVKLVAMVAPSLHANFEFHLVDLFKDTRRPDDLLSLPEALRLRGTHMLCVYGTDEHDSLCPAAPQGLMHVVSHDGGHHPHDPAGVAQLVVSDLRAAR